jgi:hypothetical protein
VPDRLEPVLLELDPLVLDQLVLDRPEPPPQDPILLPLHPQPSPPELPPLETPTAPLSPSILQSSSLLLWLSLLFSTCSGKKTNNLENKKKYKKGHSKNK